MARASMCVRRRSSASARWSAPGSSRCSVRPARSRVPRCGSRSSSPARSPMLQGYSFAKFGARYPSAGGLLEYVRQGYGDGHVTGVVAWLLLTANAIITAMVAVSFGSYASSAVDGRRRDLGQGVRRRCGRGDGRAQRRRVEGRRPGADGGRGRRDRDPHDLRGGDHLDHRPRPARPVGLPVGRRHRGERGPDVLRVLGLRRDHVHGEGPRRPAAPAAAGDVPRAGDRHRHLRRGGVGRVRHADGRGGDRVGRHGAGGGG